MEYMIFRFGGGYGPIIKDIDGLLRIAYINPNTGKKMVCPDSRCKEGCVICSRTTTRNGKECEPLKAHEIKEFVASGMICA